MKHKILTPDEIKTIDRKVLENINLDDLIAEVGVALGEWFLQNISKSESLFILYGPGNNGKDGVALGKFLKENGYRVNLVDFNKIEEKKIDKESILVDAVFGISLDNRDFPKNLQNFISLNALNVDKNKNKNKNSTNRKNKNSTNRKNKNSTNRKNKNTKNNKNKNTKNNKNTNTNTKNKNKNKNTNTKNKNKNTNTKKRIKIISIDIPTGVNAKTGEISGSAFRADVTLAVGALKPGLFIFPGRSYAGDVICIPVSSLEKNYSDYSSEFVSVDFEDVANYPRFKPIDHKYSRGVAAIVMGEKFPGAAILAAKSAQAAGAGYVKVYAPENFLIHLQLTYPEFVFVSYRNEEDLSEHILKDTKIKALCFGVGWVSDLMGLKKFFKTYQGELVVDGGAMNTPEVLEILKEKANVVFTPHKKEQDRAFGENNKVETMLNFCREYEGVLISKGYDTLIGQNKKEKAITLHNSVKLSVAGTGDVLAGLITGCMAIGFDAYESSLMAQRLQFLGARSASQRMSALDLIESIKRLKL